MWRVIGKGIVFIWFGAAVSGPACESTVSLPVRLPLKGDSC
jgi:hypothetical protein